MKALEELRRGCISVDFNPLQIGCMRAVHAFHRGLFRTV